MTKQEVVAIIDRSGSMNGKVSDAVGGINASIDELKNNKNEDDILFSLKIFDHEQKLLIRHKNITDVKKLKESDFVPRGQTALYDAIYDSLVYFMKKKEADPSSFDSCIFYVATDGIENASKKTSDELKEKVKIAESPLYNINILYLGSNQDSICEAQKMGICEGQAINYSEEFENVENVYKCAARVISDSRTKGTPINFTDSDRIKSQKSKK
jgi:uncharacterized protein YegL